MPQWIYFFWVCERCVGSIKLTVAPYVDAGRLISLTYNNNKMIIIQYCALRVRQQRVCYMIACTSLYLLFLPPIFYLNRFSFRTRGRKIVCKQLWHLPIAQHHWQTITGNVDRAVSGMLYARLHKFFCLFFRCREANRLAERNEIDGKHGIDETRLCANNCYSIERALVCLCTWDSVAITFWCKWMNLNWMENWKRNLENGEPEHHWIDNKYAFHV